MKLDFENPIQITGITFLGVLVLLILLLAVTKPSWVQILELKSGKYIFSWPLTLSYSITFSLVASIAALLVVSKRRGSPYITSKYADESKFN
jgi:hypothetical protein